MTPEQQQVLFDNTARSVGGAARHIQERHIANCTKADPAYGAGVAKALARLDVGEAPPAPRTADKNAMRPTRPAVTRKPRPALTD
jgi:catalase